MLTNQNFEIRRGETRTVNFTVADAATLTTASWRCAASRAEIPANVLLTKATGGSGITVADVGADLKVSVLISGTDSEALPTGRLFHELWLTNGAGQHVPAAEGRLTCYDSLRA